MHRSFVHLLGVAFAIEVMVPYVMYAGVVLPIWLVVIAAFFAAIGLAAGRSFPISRDVKVLLAYVVGFLAAVVLSSLVTGSFWDVYLRRSVVKVVAAAVLILVCAYGVRTRNDLQILASYVCCGIAVSVAFAYFQFLGSTGQ